MRNVRKANAKNGDMGAENHASQLQAPCWNGGNRGHATTATQEGTKPNVNVSIT